MNKELVVLFVQIILVFAIITVITIFLRFNNAYKLEKRISKYSVRYNKEKNGFLGFAKYWKKYNKFVKNQRKKMKNMLPTLISKYEKYVVSDKVLAVDYVTHKFVISILFINLTIITDIIQGRLITFIQFFFSFIIGFYILDIVLIFQRKINYKKMENDMLKAVIIMNNAFKSGKSTIQAVEIASKKLPSPLNYEFKKIYDEMSYGMSVDMVFDRFAKRTNIDAAEYLSSSLVILNRTGGNIVKVFDSIERTLFDKRKLNEELKNSTTVSKLVVKILLLIPIFIVGLIYILDPSYFNPFFNSSLGYILVVIIIIMFLIYAYLLDKIVKVDY